MNNIQRWFIFMNFLSVFCSQAAGQVVEINQLLLSALSDKRFLILSQANEDLGRYKYDLPFVEKIEFRTETDRLLTSRQEFLARTSFNGFGQKKAENEKFKNLLNWKSYKTTEVRNVMLSLAYFDILNVLNLQEQLLISRDLLESYYRKEKIFENLMINGLSVDLSDYVSIKESILRQKAKIANTKNDLKSKLLQLQTDTSLTIPSKGVISFDEAALIIQKITTDFDSHIFLGRYDAEINYLSSVMLAEKAQVSKFVDFAQVKYTVRDDLLLQNRFSVGLGFNIPWEGSYRLKQNETRIKQDVLKADKEVKKLELQVEFENLKNNFEQKYAHYYMLNEIINDPAIKNLKEQVIASGRLEPLKVVKMEESRMDITSKMFELKYEMLELYIRILRSSGELFKTPYKNFLHPLIIPVSE